MLDLQRLFDAIEHAPRRLEDGARRRIAPIRRRRLVEVRDERNVPLPRRSEDAERAYLRALKALAATNDTKIPEIFHKLDGSVLTPVPRPVPHFAWSPPTITYSRLM